MENSTELKQLNQTVVNDSDMHGKFLTFFLEQQLFAIAINDVVQIVSMQAINEIPDCVTYMKGVINLRGSIIPVIDLRLRLGMAEKAYDDRTCLIVVSIDQQEIGFIVDQVDAVVSIAEEMISAPPKIADHKNQHYLLGIAKLDSKVVLIMDVSHVLSEDILMHIQEEL